MTQFVGNGFKYSPPPGSGGGGGIPTITADMTINVPTDQPTITAALNYVRARVVLNGATVTINVESASLPTINEQITVQDESLPFVTITNDGPVNVDTTGFVPVGFPVPLWARVQNATLGGISGTWAQSAGGPSVGVAVIGESATALAGSVTGFFYDVAAISGARVAANALTHGQLIATTGATVTAEGAGVIAGGVTVQDGATYTASGGMSVNKTDMGDLFTASAGSSLSFTGNIAAVGASFGRVAVASGASRVRVESAVTTLNAGAFTGELLSANAGGDITATLGAVTFGVPFAIGQLARAITGSSVTLRLTTAIVDNGAAVFSAESTSRVTSFANALTLNTDAAVYSAIDGGTVIGDTDSLTRGAANNPTLCTCFGGRATVNLSAPLINGPSTGSRFVVSDGAVASGDAETGAANWTGGDSQVALVPTASGLILAP